MSYPGIPPISNKIDPSSQVMSTTSSQSPGNVENIETRIGDITTAMAALSTHEPSLSEKEVVHHKKHTQEMNMALGTLAKRVEEMLVELGLIHVLIHPKSSRMETTGKIRFLRAPSEVDTKLTKEVKTLFTEMEKVLQILSGKSSSDQNQADNEHKESLTNPLNENALEKTTNTESISSKKSGQKRAEEVFDELHYAYVLLKEKTEDLSSELKKCISSGTSISSGAKLPEIPDYSTRIKAIEEIYRQKRKEIYRSIT